MTKLMMVPKIVQKSGTTSCKFGNNVVDSPTDCEEKLPQVKKNTLRVL
jgi:hypothetical protein